MAGKHCADDDYEPNYKRSSPLVPKLNNLPVSERNATCISKRNDPVISKDLLLEINKILDDDYMIDFEKNISIKIVLLNDLISQKNKCFSNDLRKQTMNGYVYKSLRNFAVNFDGDVDDQIIEDLGL